jgi:hypothetical protein
MECAPRILALHVDPDDLFSPLADQATAIPRWVKGIESLILFCRQWDSMIFQNVTPCGDGQRITSGQAQRRLVHSVSDWPQSHGRRMILDVEPFDLRTTPKPDDILRNEERGVKRKVIEEYERIVAGASSGVV